MPGEVPPRAEVVVDLDAIRHNVAVLVERAQRSSAATMVVVKADGYGHGARQVATAALQAGATWLGACSVSEALALRQDGIRAPIFAWLDVPGTDYAAALAHDVELSASSERELDAITDAARAVGKTARVHLKIDTGLCRNGATADEWRSLVLRAAKAERAGQARVVAIWSHLARAEERGDPSVDAQAARFAVAYREAREAGLVPRRHLANSAATLLRSDLHFDLVRPGIAAYGLNPVPNPVGLRPAMTFRSSVVRVKRIVAGESVSYGHTWTAPEDTTLALVPTGYADGVPRTLSGRMEVFLAGRRRPVVGRVCMDQLLVDCDGDEVPPGAEVVLFGTGERGEPTAREWAETIGTIDYEIVTGMYRPRVSRRYVGVRP